MAGTLSFRCFKYPRKRVGAAIKRVMITITDSVFSSTQKEPASKGIKGSSAGIARQCMAQAIDRVMPIRSNDFHAAVFIRLCILFKISLFAS
jgi:hypothetical protein